MSIGRVAGMGIVWIAGLATIVASSVTDEEPATPPVPVTVDFTLNTQEVPLARELETRTAELDDLQVSGTYSANQGDKLTLDRSSITLDTSSQFEITVAPKTTDELLDGVADIAITADLEVGISRNPEIGQYTSLFDGTTTVVTVTASGVDVIVGGSTTTLAFSWSDFEDQENDETADLDVRMASAAYNMFDVVLRTALLAENIIDDVEDNKTTLEGMNLDSSLMLTCANTASDGEGESRLLWTTDASGTGAGDIGQGDAFEARYDNCRNADLGRYLDGTVKLDNYNPANDTGLSVFSIDADLRDLFIADTEVNIDTTPDAAAPRYNGTLLLFYVEIAVSQ